MKFIIFLCMLGVIPLVCCQAGGRMVVDAKGCTESDFTEKQLAEGCGRIVACTKFENGTISSFMATGCGQYFCDSEGTRPLPGDPTRAYPHCCDYICPEKVQH